MAMAAHVSPETLHSRIASLLVSCCLPTMRKLLEVYVAKSKTTVKSNLRTKCLALMDVKVCRDNSEKLFPKSKDPVDLESWDISLLVAVLKTACEFPEPVKYSLNSIRVIRNETFHASKLGLDVTRYQNLKTRISNALTRFYEYVEDDTFERTINAKVTKIDQTSTFNEVQLYYKLIHEWVVQDVEHMCGRYSF